MTLIEGIGDEVIQVFVALIFVLIATLAWYTTNISNEGTLRTVVLLERRRSAIVERIGNNTTVSAAVVEDTPPEGPDVNQSVSVMEGNNPLDGTNCSNVVPSAANVDEETSIVETMDASDGMWTPVPSFYDENQGTTPGGPDANQSVSAMEENNPPDGTSGGTNSTSAANVDEETNNVETLDASGGGTWTRVPSFYDENQEGNSGSADQPTQEPTEELDEGERINIKLMYINDEIRQVEGRLLETLGSFKRRNFQCELASNKLIKLIFNGRMLQTDSLTLQRYGMFDNCVVHCLVQRMAQLPSQIYTRTSDQFPRVAFRAPSTNNNQGHEWHLENYLFGILCGFLGAAWYLRYVYAHLYTVTATIGLILMTGIFTIIMYGMHFPENPAFNQQRTSNVQSPQ